MSAQGTYPIGSRTLSGSDTLTGVVTGTTADIPVSMLATFAVSSGIPVSAIETQTASLGQTVFTLGTAYQDGRPGGLAVYADGLRLLSGADYTETDSTTVTLTTAAAYTYEMVFVIGGEMGVAARGIVSVTLTSGTHAPGTLDTYTILYTDATTSTFDVYNGADGADGANGTNGTNGTNGATGNGISSITLTSGTHAPGTLDTYTITYTDLSTTTFQVYNGANGAGAGTVTSVSVVSANGLAGTVATATTTPAITLSTSVTGVLKGNGTAISAASAGTDYVSPGGALGTPSSGTATNLTGLPLTTGVTGLLPIANGGTATATPAIVAGSGISVSGSWPNQTVTATGSGMPTVVVVTGTTQTATAGNHYVLNNVAATAVTMPTTLAAGDPIMISPNNGLLTNTVDFGAKTVRFGANTMTGVVTLDLGATMELVAVDTSTWMWI